MDCISWTDRKQQLIEKYGGKKYSDAYRRIIADIKKALTQNRFSNFILLLRHDILKANYRYSVGIFFGDILFGILACLSLLIQFMMCTSNS